MNVVTKCCRVCSPSLTMSIPAFCCSCNDRVNASCLASNNSSPSNLQDDQSFPGSASHTGLGKLPAVEVGNNFLVIANFTSDLIGGRNFWPTVQGQFGEAE